MPASRFSISTKNHQNIINSFVSPWTYTHNFTNHCRPLSNSLRQVTWAESSFSCSTRLEIVTLNVVDTATLTQKWQKHVFRGLFGLCEKKYSFALVRWRFVSCLNAALRVKAAERESRFIRNVSARTWHVHAFCWFLSIASTFILNLEPYNATGKKKALQIELWRYEPSKSLSSRSFREGARTGPYIPSWL